MNRLKNISLVLSLSLVSGLSLAFLAKAKEPANSSSLRLKQPIAVVHAQTQTSSSASLEGCVTCHAQIEPMHKYGTTETLEKVNGDKDAVGLTCTACHGGNPVPRKTGDDPRSIEQIKNEAHVRASFPNEWRRDGKATGANPERTASLLARERWEFVRFVNPGDLRVAAKTCGGGACHDVESKNVARSMMTHGAMLWGAALYNNGGFPLKDLRFGESYSEAGGSQRLIQTPKPSDEERRSKGLLDFIDPIPRWEISEPGNVLRVFERGGKRRLEVGLPDKDEDPGKPDKGLSARGFGSAQRTDPVYLGLQKTRLHDPTLNFLGTNDHPGDYRSSGCSACHVIYANDRDASHSAAYHDAGNSGRSQTADLNIPKNESGHPIKHQFTSQIPTSQCMTCHMHPGTNMVATYLGMTWWDNESDGDKLYPKQQHNPTQEEEREKLNRNPEASSVRGLWSDLEFLNGTGTPEFNSLLKNTQFGDFHSHGWLFRKVFKRDRKGNLLDAQNNLVAADDPDKFKKAVHLNDIHLEKGMHCVDCHFRQDSHGDGNLYNEPRAAIEITCEDCHGSIRARANLFTSGPAAATATGTAAERRKSQNQPLSGQDLTRGIRVRDETGTKIPLFQRIPRDRKKKDENGKDVDLKTGDIIQNSMVVPGRWWRVIQTLDTITPGTRDYSERSRYSKTIRKDNATWGDVPADGNALAHRDSDMTCVSCHSSWVTSCFGCHLSMQANRKMPNRHNEGGDSRNFTQYNFQVLRDDIFMLGRDGTVTGNRVAPVRSSSAILVSSQNQNREWIYSQQQTTSAEGFAGQTFNTHVPHTVRATETKSCTDCHVSTQNDNNAWLAQLLLQGTNFVNFMGRYVYVAADDALEVVVATEHTEPQAVFGSSLQKIAYPDNYSKFVNGGSELETVYEHVGNPKVLQVQLRGEYAYVAAGEGGLRVYDVAQIDQKGFSERITTAPVSRFGQKFWVKTKYATAVAAPTTLAVDPARWRMKTDGTMIDPESASKLTGEARKQLVNEEQPIHPLYAYLYVVDKYEGLILVNAATLLDGDPLNNYLKRALEPAKYPKSAFNPNGALTDANNITIAGHYAYVTTARGLVVVDIDDPMNPRVTEEIAFRNPRAIAIQFRYGFIVDDDGMKVLDLSSPGSPKVVPGASVALADAHDVYVARTYAYVANGKEGIAIVDVEQPEKPRLDQTFNAGGKLNDTHQVKVAMTNASLFAYVADGKNGLRILQLTSPETMPEYAGFSPRPQPVLIASFKTKGEALGISKPLDRDRAVDESGNQISVFGRRGARPFNFDEMMRMLRTNDGTGEWFTVTDAPLNQPKP
ncbi:MAG TPA: multiheme c-type cytochrome [Pyrinomonadaceae bacterium]|nr:multiheme c-type cytochrome [Pyrinomonadaceae bacterium]